MACSRLPLQTPVYFFAIIRIPYQGNEVVFLTFTCAAPHGVYHAYSNIPQNPLEHIPNVHIPFFAYNLKLELGTSISADSPRPRDGVSNEDFFG